MGKSIPVVPKIIFIVLLLVTLGEFGYYVYYRMKRLSQQDQKIQSSVEILPSPQKTEDSLQDYIQRRFTGVQGLVSGKWVNSVTLAISFKGEITQLSLERGSTLIEGLLQTEGYNSLAPTLPETKKEEYVAKLTFVGKDEVNLGKKYTFYFKPKYFEKIKLQLLETSNGKQTPLERDDFKVGDIINLTYVYDLSPGSIAQRFRTVKIEKVNQ